MNFDDFIFICSGTLTTLSYTLMAVFFGFLLSIPIVAMRLSNKRFLTAIAKIYISVIRGTPIILQLSLWYFAFPRFVGLSISSFVAGSLAFSVNSSAYLAEVLRSALEALDKGQIEAARVLGISKKDTLLDILLPQAIKNISPTIMNEMVSMLKETAIIGMIGVRDLMRRAQLVSTAKYDFFTPLFIAALCYYLVGLALTTGYNIIAKKYKRTLS